MALLSTFMIDAFTALGGLAEVSSDVLEAVAPGGAGLPESVRLWVGDGACPDDEDMLHLGHPALEATLAAVRADACCGVRHLSVARRRMGVEALARKALGFRNARATFGEEGTAAVPVLVFWFRVTFTWDEKREELVRVAVDAQTGRVFDAEALDRAYLDAGPAADAEVRLEGVEQAARAELARRVEPRVVALDREARRHLEVERARLEEYYRGVLADLERRGRGADTARQEALAAKRASTEADLETRRRDLEDKYRVRVSARLCAVERVDVPRARVSVRLEGRKGGRDAVVSYNFLTRALDPWPCEGCGRALSAIYLCREGHLVCPACASECEGCRALACRACGAAQCELCPTMRCPACDGACETCGRGTCGRHRGDCHAVAEAPPGPKKAKAELKPSITPPKSSGAPARARNEKAQVPSKRSGTPVRGKVGNTPASSSSQHAPAAARGRAWTVPRLVFQVFGGWCKRYPHLEEALRPVDACLSEGDLRGAAHAVERLMRACGPGPLRTRLQRVHTVLVKHPTSAVPMLMQMVSSAPRASDPTEDGPNPSKVLGPRAEIVARLVESVLEAVKARKALVTEAHALLRAAAPAIERSSTEVTGWAAAVAYEVLRSDYKMTLAEAGAWLKVSAATVNNRLQAVREATGRLL